MSKTLEGMARALNPRVEIKKEQWTNFQESDALTETVMVEHVHLDMRAALLWLADNVSDEMLNAFFNEKDRSKNFRDALSAALRAAAGENTLSTTGDENA